MFPIRNFRRFFNKFLKQPFYALKVAKKRFLIKLSYKLKFKEALMPEAITIFLTHRCNLSCKMCGQWGEMGITRKQDSLIVNELSFETLQEFIDQISFFRPNITLFGGEPLLYKDCVKLVRYIKEKKLHCLIITNGWLLEEKIIDLVNAGLDELNISLDGAQELHDSIRGLPGLFNKIAKGLIKLKMIKQKNKLKKPLLNIQTTINQYNYLRLEELLDVAENFGANSLTFHNLIFVFHANIEKQKEIDKILNNSSSNWEGFLFSPNIDVDILYKKIKKILSNKYSFDVDFYPNFSYKELKEYYLNPAYKPKQYSFCCLSPWTAAYVFPDGSIKPCLNFSYSFGNIKDKSFKQIWNSQNAKFFRKVLQQNKAFPICTRCTELFRY
ncbi:MAG: radical SAM protein [Candidatus Omnitrophica bacterium]|nr:radical SAM protein [Candidatus Omnitrophota bacterium]